MRYVESDEHGVMKEQVETIDKTRMVSLLEFIRRGYMPDYNYETGENEDYEEVCLPDCHYPMHIAMLVAMDAIEEIEKYDPKFFDKMNIQYDNTPL